MELSVSIVNYNTREQLKICLQSVLETTRDLDLEVLVVDNASTDGSAAMVKKDFPMVRLIENTANRYYSKAHNQAWAISSGTYFLILNSDIQIRDRILSTLLKFMRDHADVGAATCRMFSSENRLYRNCSNDYSLTLAFLNFTFLGKIYRGLWRRYNERTFLVAWDRESTRDVEVAPDSLLMVRRQTIERIGGLYDERLSLYFTENDLCDRIRAAGDRVTYVAEGDVVHLESSSVKKVDPRKIGRLYRADIFQYFRRSHGWLKAVALLVGIHFTRLLIWTFQTLRLHKFKPNLVWGI